MRITPTPDFGINEPNTLDGLNEPSILSSHFRIQNITHINVFHLMKLINPRLRARTHQCIISYHQPLNKITIHPRSNRNNKVGQGNDN